MPLRCLVPVWHKRPKPVIGGACQKAYIEPAALVLADKIKKRSILMALTLPELPYAYDALGPYMSKETLEFHHDKHHHAYVTNGNNLLKDSPLAGQSLSKIVKA